MLWKLLSIAVKQQRLAAAWRRELQLAAPALCHCACVHRWPERASSRSGRRCIVDPAALGCLAGPPGHTAELRDLWSPCESPLECVCSVNRKS